MVPMPVVAQDAQLDAVLNRYERNGTAFPQEKVYVHMDNTCYFVGDTIWYAAYLLRTDKDTPSNISRVLYVELLTSDGYLAERQLVEMNEGRGHGCFALHDSYHGGFYELRAYTRWQLNWGRTEHPHAKEAEAWFLNKELVADYYRDYEKLYSRVFPVYDKPKAAGEFFHDMTGRPLRRYFSGGAPEPQPTLSLFPEGGHLVAGAACRVAFEAVKEDGEVLEGTVTVTDGNGAVMATAQTTNRGRGLLILTPEAGVAYRAEFISTDGKLRVSSRLPEVERDGVALRVEQTTEGWQIQAKATGTAADRRLAVAVLHEGRVVMSGEKNEGVKNEEYKLLKPAEGNSALEGTFYSSLFPLSLFTLPGVYQAVAFDADGHLYADRLFFVTKPEMMKPTLDIAGIKPQYEPFEAIELHIRNSAQSPASLSVAVHDAVRSDRLYDNGNILTEMLLASEVRGFIPDPAWFFESDDEAHRSALDLLMMTQGWRRFDWQQMTRTEKYIPEESFENPTQVIRGEVYAQAANDKQTETDGFGMDVMGEDISPYRLEQLILSDRIKSEPSTATGAYVRDRKFLSDSIDLWYNGRLWEETRDVLLAQLDAKSHQLPAGSYRMKADIARARTPMKRIVKKPLILHAECIQPGSPSAVEDIKVSTGKVGFRMPVLGGQCILFLSVADSTRCNAKKPYLWIDPHEDNQTDYFLRIHWPYPRFTRPYDFYQQKLMPGGGSREAASAGMGSFDTDLQEVTVGASHGGLRKFDASAPVLKLDACDVFNEVVDAGLTAGRYIGRTHFANSVARLIASDMHSRQSYLLEPRYDTHNTSFNIPASQMELYNHLKNIDSVFIYTDYAPRNTYDTRNSEDNLGRITVDLRLTDEGTERLTYRDRRLILPCFSEPDDFYHPDYSRRKPSESDREFYRRTLYWNPNLQLNDEGKATIRFYNNGRQTSIAVSAEGMTKEGRLMMSEE